MKKTDTKGNARPPQAIVVKRAAIEFDAGPSDPAAYQEVAALAYSYWEGRGYRPGSAEEDWLRAEEELRGRRAQMRVAKEPRAAAKGAGA